MAVNSCKIFDETAICGSNEVSNTLPSAESAGDGIIIDETTSVPTTSSAESLQSAADQRSHIKSYNNDCQPVGWTNKVCDSNNNNNNNSTNDTRDYSNALLNLAKQAPGCAQNPPFFIQHAAVVNIETLKVDEGFLSPETKDNCPDTRNNVPLLPREKYFEDASSVEMVNSDNSKNKNSLMNGDSNVEEGSCKEGDDHVRNKEEETIQHPDWMEERFRVDRRKLEQMLQAAADGKGQSGDDFFSQIKKQTGVEHITWPSKLKIGAKSKKDPHIKVVGMQAGVVQAKELIMRVLDTKCTRVTLKMDVSHTEHSHVIGKGGNNIKKVMEETGCHIHFPDSNRSSAAEKSNQVSIAGQPAGVEDARDKIRALLPVVVSFDLQVTSSLPDPNSPPIQQIVQMYCVSIQFKQRPSKSYCPITCIIRGSAHNTTGLVNGTHNLMQHLIGGTMAPVVSEMEVAPQQHSYMLGRNATNVKHIMQRTGAQIRFPDPNVMTLKRSTITITGTVESVVLARKRLVGCLPLVLMFDVKQDDSVSSVQEAEQNGQIMETLDVFISVKLKPKQPSKSVIVKSVERNFWGMFEARRRMLGLVTTGIKSPPPPSVSPPISLQANTVATPIIHLTHPPVSPSPHLKPQYIGIVPHNAVALVNGSAMTQLPRVPTPTVSPLLTQNWATSPMPSPSQSPFPVTQQQQATAAVMRAQQQQQQLQLMQVQLNVQQQQQQMPIITSTNASRASSMAGSPPQIIEPSKVSQFTKPPSAKAQQAVTGEDRHSNILQVTQKFIRDNKQSGEHIDNPAFVSQQATNDGTSYVNPLMSCERWSRSDARAEPSPARDCDTSATYRHKSGDDPEIENKVRGIQRHLLEVGMLSADSSFNHGSGDARRRPSIGVDDGDGFGSLQTRDEPTTSSVDDYDNRKSNFMQVSKNTNQLAATQRNSPRASPGHKAPSPADRSQLDNDAFDGSGLQQGGTVKRRNPPSLFISSDRQSFATPHNATHGYNPQSDHGHLLTVTGFKRQHEQCAGTESDTVKLQEYYQQQHEISSPAPPPGFEHVGKHTNSTLNEIDYELARQRAFELTKKQTVTASKIRTPTDRWSGLGFSRSMPSNQLNQLKNKFTQELETTFEGDDVSAYEEKNEQADISTASGASLEAPITLKSSHVESCVRTTSALTSWRERHNHNFSQSMSVSALGRNNLALGGNTAATSLVKRRQHTTFYPRPNEYMNQSLPTPPHPNDEPADQPSVMPAMLHRQSAIQTKPPDTSLRAAGGLNAVSNQSLDAAFSVLSEQNLGGGCQANGIELRDLLQHLNLDKYADVFTNQEVDLQTFLTLTDSDLTELGITAFGPRKKILLAIEELKKHRNSIQIASVANTDFLTSQSSRTLTPQASLLEGFFKESETNNSIRMVNNRPSNHQGALSHRSGGRNVDSSGGQLQNPSSSSQLLYYSRGAPSHSGRW